MEPSIEALAFGARNRVDSRFPGIVDDATAITGTTLVGIDFRPVTGVDYNVSPETKPEPIGVAAPCAAHHG